MHPQAQKHPFKPVYDEHSKVLILGSFPPKNSSQKGGFYYADSSNRFWSVLGTLFDTPNLADKSKDEKISFLKAHHIALYDIWGYCYKENADSSRDDDIIADESQKADLSEIFQKAKIQKIFNSKKSKNYNKNKRHSFIKWGIESWLWEKYAKFMLHCKNASEMVVPLYSTSSASRLAGISDEILLDDYEQIVKICKK